MVLKRVTKNRNIRKMEHAFSRWNRYSQELEYHCRVTLLHRDFTRKSFLTQSFTEMRVCTTIAKQDRFRVLNKYFKALQDYKAYNRHLMQANMAAIAFRNNNSQYTLRCCFQGLRNYTEKNKFILLRYAVNEDMNVAIADTEKFN